jgi:hypothetical protein
MTYKFNKTNVLEHLWARKEALEKEWGFDPDNGYAQLDKSDFHRVMAYGKYIELENLINDIEWKNIKEAA